MKDTTKKMLQTIDEVHDWCEGQMFSRGGTELHSTDTCRVCGLRRHFRDDDQNGVDAEYRFSDSETGADLTLRQALARGCAD